VAKISPRPRLSLISYVPAVYPTLSIGRARSEIKHSEPGRAPNIRSAGLRTPAAHG